MRTQKIILISTFGLSLNAFAAMQDTATLQTVAQNWLQDAAQKGLVDSAELNSLSPLGLNEDESLFQLGRFGNDGWMLLSSDDLLLPVVGFGNGLAGELPEALRDRLEMEAAMVAGSNATSSAAASSEWSRLVNYQAEATRSMPATNNDVEALITAEYHQGTGWNSYCPEDPAGPDGHTYVGCVAVALGQVMSYWNWPQTGIGDECYPHDVYGTICADFGSTTYDWNAMSDQGATDATAQMLFHAGVSVDMYYGVAGGSSSQTSRTVGALINHFQYEQAATMYWRMSFSDAEWHDLLNDELASGRPMIYRGQGSAGGHCFNVDGVQDSTWYHVNWGWGGSYNGYFLLDDMSPGNWTFNSYQGAVVGIEPAGEAPNVAPQIADMTIQSLEDETVTIELPAYDGDNDLLTHYVNGQQLLDNEWSWTPDSNVSGEFSFIWFAFDGQAWSQPATITLDVLAVNDAPKARNLSFQVTDSDSVIVKLLAHDIEDDRLKFYVDSTLVAGEAFWYVMDSEVNEVVLPWYAYDGEDYSNGASITITRKSLSQNTGSNAGYGEADDDTEQNGNGDGFVVDAPKSTGLSPAWPNPFNPVTNLNFTLETAGQARLVIFNLLGQEVAQLVDGNFEAGTHTARWMPEGVASGTYLAVLFTEAGMERRVLQYIR